MDKRNVVVVETPLQLLNALEYRERTELRAVDLLVLLVPPFTRERFAHLYEGYDWRSVEVLRVLDERDVAVGSRDEDRSHFLLEQYKNLRRLRLRRLLDGFARRRGEVDTLVVGNLLAEHKDHIRHLANVIRYRNLVMVDDGTDTLRINEERRVALAGGDAVPATPAATAWKKSLRRRWFDLCVAEVPSLTYFTTYELPLLACDRLVPNDYRALRARVHAASVTEETYFLGQPLPGDGYLPADAYTRAVLAAQRFLAPLPFTYVAHPRESTADLAELAAAGLRIVRFDRPIEQEMVVSGRRPRRLSGFFCSALENCAVIFGSELPVSCFQLAAEDLEKNQAETIDIYRALQRHVNEHFEIVAVPDGDAERAGAAP